MSETVIVTCTSCGCTKGHTCRGGMDNAKESCYHFICGGCGGAFVDHKVYEDQHMEEDFGVKIREMYSTDWMDNASLGDCIGPSIMGNHDQRPKTNIRRENLKTHEEHKKELLEHMADDIKYASESIVSPGDTIVQALDGLDKAMAKLQKATKKKWEFDWGETGVKQIKITK